MRYDRPHPGSVMRPTPDPTSVAPSARVRTDPRPIVTIGLVDNDAFALAFLARSIVELMPEARVRWSVTSGREAIERCLDPRDAPDVLLTDMSMDGLSGSAVCRAIRSRTARTAILAVTSFSLNVYAGKAAQAGAQGIVAKSVEASIIGAIRTVAAGGTWCPDGVAIGRRVGPQIGLLDGFQTAAAAHERLRGSPTPRRMLLSDREAEAMDLCSHGLTTDRIAAAMGVGVTTAKTYLTRAIHKLGASSRGQAVAMWTGAGGEG